MKTALFLLFLLSLSLPLSAQHFLDRHLGEYTGTMHICQPGKPDETLPFKMIIARTDTPDRWSNTVLYNYNDPNPVVKDYEWVLDPAYTDDIHYIMDEKDGILIAETRIDNTFYSQYEVDGRYYFVRTTFGKKTIGFELSCYNTAGKTESRSEPDENGLSWAVSTCPLFVVQKGTLYRQKPGKK